MRLWAIFLAGCSPSLAAMHPADVLEDGEMHVGMATGVIAPIPARREEPGASGAAQVASPAGFSYEIQVRRGFEDEWEAGLRLSPASAAVDGRWLLAGERDWVATLGGGLGATFLGALVADDVDRYEPDGGWRADAGTEILVGRNWSDVLRVWTGPRFSLGRFSADGTADGAASSASGWVGHAGLTFGVSAGYRWIHAAAELTPTWVFSSAEVEGEELPLGGLLLQPTFGLWFRF